MEVYQSTRLSQLKAARFCGLTWAEYVALPGHPKWIDPLTGSWSKCDVLVHYQHETLAEAIRQEIQMEQQERYGASTYR